MVVVNRFFKCTLSGVDFNPGSQRDALGGIADAQFMMARTKERVKLAVGRDTRQGGTVPDHVASALGLEAQPAAMIGEAG